MYISWVCQTFYKKFCLNHGRYGGYMRIYDRCVEGVEIYFLIYSLFYTLPHAIWISTRVGDYHMTTTIAVRTYAGTPRRRTHDIIKNKE
jgi:hypothetical protein